MARTIRPWLSAVASGLLLALAIPGIGWSAVAWVALIPLFRAIAGEPPGRAFWLGWVAGMVSHLGSLYWVANPIVHYTAISGAVAAGIVGLLCAALSIYVGVFAAGVRYWEQRTGADGLVLAVTLWTGLEWIRSSFGLPFPWNLLGYTQPASGPLVQMAEVTGIYGPGAMIVAVNYVIHPVVGGRFVSRLERRRLPFRLAAVSVLLSGAFVSGASRLAEIRATESSDSIRVGFVQPGIDPKEKWDPLERVRIVEIQESLSRPLPALGAEVVVWPEASAPFLFAPDSFYERDEDRFAFDRQLRDRMVAFAEELGVPIVFGSPVIVTRPSSRGEIWNSRNRAFLLAPSGRVEATYDKMILVPFGEYVPMAPLLPFVDKLVPGVGMFEPGDAPTLFKVGGRRLAVLICYEAIFPGFVGRFAEGGAELFVNLTNDAWFGETVAPEQHLAMAAVRAVETRTSIVRVANTGISAVVSPDGRIERIGALLERTAGVREVPWSNRSTFYMLHGDLFAVGSALVALVLLAWASFVSVRADPSLVGS